MDSENYQSHQPYSRSTYATGEHRSYVAPNRNDNRQHGATGFAADKNGHSTEAILTGLQGAEPRKLDASDILQYIRAGELLVINKRQRNGLILYKSFHAEFAGPGSAVGGFFDQDCERVTPVGELSLALPENHEERKEAYLIRRQWIRLTQQFTDNSSPVQRAQMILNQFETYFDPETINRLSDEAFALMVGVLPYTIRIARRTPNALNVKVKA